MPVTRFPDPASAPKDGLLALGGDLYPDTLLLAYRNGIFPWPMPEVPLAWFSPDPRAVLEFADLHIPKSLTRSLKRARASDGFRTSINAAFEAVIRACAAAPRSPGQGGPNVGTWITPEMIEAYVRLHRLGRAVSAEVWQGDELVGGIYAVAIDGVFSAESMFHSKTDMSKLALLALIEHARKQGATWLDIQMMSPHLKALGAKEISRAEFLSKLSKSFSRKPAS